MNRWTLNQLPQIVFLILKFLLMNKVLLMLQFKKFQLFNQLICFLNPYKLIPLLKYQILKRTLKWIMNPLINKIKELIYLLKNKLPVLLQKLQLHSQLICSLNPCKQLKVQRTLIIMNNLQMYKVKTHLVFKHQICFLNLFQLKPIRLPLLLLIILLIINQVRWVQNQPKQKLSQVECKQSIKMIVECSLLMREKWVQNQWKVLIVHLKQKEIVWSFIVNANMKENQWKFVEMFPKWRISNMIFTRYMFQKVNLFQSTKKLISREMQIHSLKVRNAWWSQFC